MMPISPNDLDLSSNSFQKTPPPYRPRVSWEGEEGRRSTRTSLEPLEACASRERLQQRRQGAGVPWSMV